MDEFKNKEMDLYYRYKAGDQSAKTELISSLTPLILSQANKFNNSGLPTIAIKLEGQKLASQAIDTYDPSKAQLNTHVTNYLQKISRFVTNYQNVGHIPEPRALLIGKYNTITANLESDKGREPTTHEIADAMQINLAEVERLQTELRKDLSTSVIADDEDDSGFYEYISPMSYDPKMREAIDFTYFDADPTDKKILEYTLGLYGNPKRKGKEIAMALGISELELKRRRMDLAKQIKELA